MSCRKKGALFIAVLALAIFFPGTMSHSGEASLIAQGNELWAQRDNMEKTKEAIALWENAAKDQPKNELLWIKIAEAYHWINENTPMDKKQEKVELCKKGMEAAKMAIKANPESVGGWFWLAVIQGRITEAVGILRGGFDFGLCLNATLMVASKDISFYYGGLYRYWGRIIWSVPAIGRKIASFSLLDSVNNYKKSLEIEPDFFMTRLYLAETYIKIGDKEKAEKELNYIVNTPADVLPEYAPDNRLYQRQAKKLLERLKG